MTTISLNLVRRQIMNWSVNSTINDSKDIPHPHDKKQEFKFLPKYDNVTC